MNTVDLLLIGTGRWGSVIQKNLESMPGVGTVFTATKNWKEVLERSPVQGVIIATPPSTHAEIALACITKGLPVYIEKPMTLSSTEGEQIITASNTSGVPVIVGHIHLFNGAFIKLKELVETYGGALHIETEAANFGPYRPDYSVIWDYASHDVSMVLDLLQEIPSNVSTSATALSEVGTRNWDISDIHFTFPSGITATVRSSRLSPTKVRKVTVTCARATLVYDDTLSGKKLAVYEQLTPRNLAELGAGKAVLEPTFPEYEATSPLVREIQTFMSVITERKNTVSDAVFGNKVVKVLEEADATLI